MKKKKLLLIICGIIIILGFVFIISFIYIKNNNANDGNYEKVNKDEPKIDFYQAEKIDDKKLLKEQIYNNLKVTNFKIYDTDSEFFYILFDLVNTSSKVVKAGYFEISLLDNNNKVLLTLVSKLENNLKKNQYESIIVSNNEIDITEVKAIKFNFDSINK